MNKTGNRRILIVILSLIATAMFCAAATFAYFQTNLKVNGFANIKIHLIFDKLSDSALTEYRNNLVDDKGNPITLGQGDYEWGYKGNPYVISDTLHLLNLSTLQNIGYFDRLFIDKNYEHDKNNVRTTLKTQPETEYYDGFIVPYFYVSTPDGEPVVINGTDEIIEPVGNHEYPFIGVINGASGINATSTIAGKTTNTSAIYDIVVQSNESDVDYGFFGNVSHLGEPPKPIEGQTPEDINGQPFTGFVSKINNLLFADVKVVVKHDTVWNTFNKNFKSHHYVNTIVGVNPGTETDPQETHHIGIVSGHIEYTNISKISVYYSDETKVALDFTDNGKKEDNKPMNYMSSTGYFGYMDNLNPQLDPNDRTKIILGSGLDSSEVSAGYGTGGGGELSGNYPGYIRADDVFNIYNHYMDDPQGTIPADDRDLILINAYDEAGNRLAQNGLNTNSNEYYITDTVFTFGLSSGQEGPAATDADRDTIEDVWKKDKETGTVTVDEIRLSNNWAIGDEGGKQSYYKNIKQINTIKQLNKLLNDGTQHKFYIGKVTGQKAQYIDLKTQVKFSFGAETKINAQESKGVLQDSAISNNQLVFSYNTEADRAIDTGYGITITKVERQGQNNNKEITYKFSLNEKYLGVYSGISNKIVCVDPNLVGGLNHFEFNLTVNNNGEWTLKETNSQENIGFDGTKFYVGFWGGTTAVPIKIYVDQGDESKVVVEPKHLYLPDPADKVVKPANTHVLIPQIEYGINSPNGNPINSNKPKANVTDGRVEYELKALSDLGWRNHLGEPLWPEGGNASIRKMFNIKKSVNWNLTINIGRFGLGLGDANGQVIAPVGKLPQAYVPTGSIAFNINKVPKNGAKIRVVVKTPSTDKAGALGFNGDSGSEDYFLGIWKGKVKDGGSFISAASFDKKKAEMYVELPRSQPLTKGTEPYIYNGVSADNEFITVSYTDKNTGTTNNYKSYLQGGNYLIAYEFKVTNPGLYIIASSNSNMQICYCSADGVSSKGRDGTGVSAIGNIDFVYDNGSKIILTTDVAGADVQGEDPTQYYYESNILVHFDCYKAVADGSGVHNELIHIYRAYKSPPGGGDKQTTIVITADTANSYAKCDKMNDPHDVVEATNMPNHTDIS